MRLDIKISHGFLQRLMSNCWILHFDVWFLFEAENIHHLIPKDPGTMILSSMGLGSVHWGRLIEINFLQFFLQIDAISRILNHAAKSEDLDGIPKWLDGLPKNNDGDDYQVISLEHHIINPLRRHSHIHY